jgi:hypothetical protein
MAKINADTVRVLSKRITDLRARLPNSWRDGVDSEVHAWIAEYMPQLPRPHLHVRVLEDATTGRVRAKVTFTLKPMCADIQISTDTGTVV